DGLLGPALSKQHVPEPDAGLNEPGLQTHGFQKMWLGLQRLALQLQGRRQIVMRAGNRRVNPYRFPEEANRFLRLALQPEYGSPVIIGIGITRLDPYRFPEVADGFVWLA